jgi:hypothetical protein
MGRRTSIYLTDEDLERVRALGFPPLGEVFRAGLAAAEEAAGRPAQTANDSHVPNGGPAHISNDSQQRHGGPAHPSYESHRSHGGPAQARNASHE